MQGRGFFHGAISGMSLLTIECWNDHRRFTEPHEGPVHAVWFQQTGCFVNRVSGRESLIDPMAGVVLRRGEERQVAHPHGRGDTGTELSLPAELALRLPAGPFPIGPALELARRRLVAACARGIDAFELADRLHALLRLIPDPPHESRRTPATRAEHGRMVTRARLALIDGDVRLGLDDLAALAGYSAHHLSRVFREVTGMTLTAYRNELRVRAVLEDLAAGERSLSALSARHGFADHGHLTRVVRRHLGRTPREIRDQIAHERPSAG